MAPEHAVRKVRVIDFARARDEGLEHVDEIAALYEERLSLSRAELRRYLLENICFELDEEMLAGLDLFYHLAHKHGLITSLKPVKWIG
jgi:hypothetical protein